MKASTNELKTVYEENIGDTPWIEYPRPQFKRDSYICLNGEWDFEIIDKNEKLPSSFSKKIIVPFPPESRLSGIGEAIGRGRSLVYRRIFDIPDGFIKDRLLLHFGAVDQTCKIYINGRFACDHSLGYLSFSVDITDFVTKGENEITVITNDELSPIYPYGKQKRDRGGMWYTPVSGIWQTVWLESISSKAINSIKITPSLSDVRIDIDSDSDAFILTLESGDKYCFSGKSIAVTPETIRLWSPEDPYIYRFTLECDTDKIESYFALREIGVTDDKRLTLNGKPYIFNGLLDQGYFPDGIFLPASPMGYKDDVLLAKSLGFNMLRKHIKIEPDIFYSICDELGIIVFQDAVNNSDYSFIRDTALPTVGIQKLPDTGLHKDAHTRDAFLKQLSGMQDQLYNFPSVLVYTIFNEGWGQFCSDAVYEIAKTKDPSRLYDSTSGWFRQSNSDFDSRHIYFKRLKIKKPDGKPLFISEFGGYSFRVEGHLFSNKNYGYKSFADRQEFENALIALYETEVIPLAKEGVCAFVYTQLSDVEDETNGFVTYDRKVLKVDRDKFKVTMNKLYDTAK